MPDHTCPEHETCPECGSIPEYILHAMIKRDCPLPWGFQRPDETPEELKRTGTGGWL